MQAQYIFPNFQICTCANDQTMPFWSGKQLFQCNPRNVQKPTLGKFTFIKLKYAHELFCRAFFNYAAILCSLEVQTSSLPP